nr:MAG TPA: hypothetical protein [Caudoviricetes sp.]
MCLKKLVLKITSILPSLFKNLSLLPPLNAPFNYDSFILASVAFKPNEDI